MTPSKLRPDRLRWIISSLLLAPALAANAQTLNPAAGPGGLPVVSTAHGVPVIDIVAPNGHGISHNQFLDFNVGAQGTVLNNSLQAGDSVLAGVLQANAQFQGQAASAIINEVVGLSATQVLGAQEVFGQRAAYILANPNGITVNGASSINIAQMTFLVGTPQLQDGQLKELSTLHSQGKLSVEGQGLAHAGGALDLLTPYVETTAPITGAEQDLNLIVGHNRIDPLTRTVLHTAAPDPSAAVIDAQLLGAMQGGRIRIVSTTQGAGVRLPQALRSSQGVRVESAGAIEASGQAGERVRRAQIEGGAGNVLLHAADNLTLTAVDVAGRDLGLKAGKHLRLDAATARRLENQREQYQRKAWIIPTEEFSKNRDEVITEHAGSRLVATAAIDLQAAERLDISASTVQADGRLSASAGDQMLIDGRADRSEITETVRHRKHLWRGDSDQFQASETAAGSALSGAGIELQSGGSVHVRGSLIDSEGGLRIAAQDRILVDSVELNDTSRERESRGDAMGGLFKNRLSSTDTGLAHQRGSRIVANGSQQLVSDGELTIVGSQATAGNVLEVKAKGPVNILAGASHSQEGSAQRDRGFTANASQTRLAEDGKAESRQYTAGIGYSVEQQRRDTQRTVHQGAALQGQTVSVNSDSAIKVQGSSLTSTAGTTQLGAPKVELLASVDREIIDTRTRDAGGSLQVGGGIDRLSSAFKGNAGNEQVVRDSQSAVVTRIDAAGDLRLDTPHLSTEGSQLTAGGELAGTFSAVDNRAAISSVSDTRTGSQWQGTLGASLEYRDLTRPIEKLVLGQEQTRYQQPGVEDALAPPSVGADLDLAYKQRAARAFDSSAQVTRFEGKTVDVNVAEQLVDHATQWVANGGVAKIVAGSHEQHAVTTLSENSVQRLDVEGGVRVDSNTGSDLNVRLSGLGSSIDRSSRKETAVLGNLSGSGGLQVQLGSDGRYEGGRFDGGSGAVSIKAGGSLDFAQANDRQHLEETLIDGSAWAKGGTSPTAGKSFGASAVGQYGQRSSDDSQARTVQFTGQGAVVVRAEGDLRMAAGRVGSAEAKVASMDFSAAGKTELLASIDSHSASGRSLGGGLQPNLGSSAQGGSGGLGGSLNMGRVKESGQTGKGGDFHVTEHMALGAGSRGEDALRIQGLHADAGSIALAADKGGLIIEAATTHEQRDNLAAAGGLAVSVNRNQDVDKNAHGGFARASLNLDRLDSSTHGNSQLRAESAISLNSRLDSRLSGATLDAQQVTGSIGGDLLVESLQDAVSGLKIDADARLSSEKNPQGLLNGVSSFAGPAAAKVKEVAGSKIQLFDTGLTPSLDVTVVKQDRNTVGQSASIKGLQGIELDVAGDTRLTGANLKGGKAGVELGGSRVHQQTLVGSDYRAEAIVDLSNAPVDLAEGIVEAAKRKMSGETSIDLGLIRAGGHDDEQVLTSSID